MYILYLISTKQWLKLVAIMFVLSIAAVIIGYLEAIVFPIAAGLGFLLGSVSDRIKERRYVKHYSEHIIEVD